MKANELAQRRTMSICVAASDDVEDSSDFPEVWQARGLTGEGQELREGALTGATGRGTIPTDMMLLLSKSSGKWQPGSVRPVVRN